MEASRVGILTDSTASIPRHIAEELQIEIVPYHVIREGQDLRDGEDVKPRHFAEYLAALRDGEKLPTTSFPGPGEYVQGFKKLAGRTREIVALTMTSKGSGAYQSCCTAAELMRDEMADLRITVVDTLQVAMAHGWAAIEAARAAARNASHEQVTARARAVANSAFMVQTADTLRYLMMGGRIGRAQHLVGSLLDLKPIIGMADGEISALGTARSRARAYARMVELVRERIENARHVHLAFTHCGAEAQAQVLRDLYFRRSDCIEEMTTPLSPALAVHSGPGTVGICMFAD
jgi:DegV family protein with EDD domain